MYNEPKDWRELGKVFLNKDGIMGHTPFLFILKGDTHLRRSG